MKKNTLSLIAIAVAASMLSPAHAAVTTSANSASLDPFGHYSSNPAEGDSAFGDTASGSSQACTTATCALTYSFLTDPTATGAAPVGYPPATYEVSGNAASTDNLLSLGSWSTSLGAYTKANSCFDVGCLGGFSYSIASMYAVASNTFHLDADTAFTLSTTFLIPPPNNGDGSFASGSLVLQLVSEDNVFAVNESWDGSTLPPLLPFSGLLTGGKDWTVYVALQGNVSSSDGFAGLVDASSSAQLNLTPVPLPGAAWLLMSGIGGLAAVVRRRRQAAVA